MEVAVALGLATLIVSMLVEVYTLTTRVLARLDIERAIRDQGIFAVENIEKAFREVSESGGKIKDISNDRITVAKDSLTVTLSLEGEQLRLAVVRPSSENIMNFPDGGLKCKSLRIKALCGDEYVEGSRAAGLFVRVVLVEFTLEDRSQNVSKLFKAAFRAN
ncbi:MAG: hypothetical protein IMF26_09025 [Candidatus Fermentithermobacillus carboniphilus]|uniref:Uncharacterized protein n=1 Tax=Candidatus Fermentithermobacillus carboniphilus TaxID=3085328 RepID=A0AAT9LAP6_9FIRM|nr:MAG: hypothetical protein IMF26_09025 [Candidatus Fermentithermobacillus carboniphilus]